MNVMQWVEIRAGTGGDEASIFVGDLTERTAAILRTPALDR